MAYDESASYYCSFEDRHQRLDIPLRELLAADLQALLGGHRDFLARHAASYDGHIIKAAGDGYWLEFPSVTAAAKAAIEMRLYGRDVWIASQLQSASAKLLGREESGVFVTAAVRSALFGTPSRNRLQHVALLPLPAALAGIEVYRLCNANFEQ